MFNIAEANKAMEIEKFDKEDIKKIPKDAAADEENDRNDSDTLGNDNDGPGNNDDGPGNDDDGPGFVKVAANTDNEDDTNTDNGRPQRTDSPSNPYLIFLRGG